MKKLQKKKKRVYNCLYTMTHLGVTCLLCIYFVSKDDKNENKR